MQLKIRFSDHLIAFLALLQLMFIGLRISYLIDWNILWITAPTWGGILIFLIAFIVKTVRDAMKPFRKG